MGGQLPPSPSGCCSPWDSSGHHQAVSWVWANPHAHPCTCPVSSGLSLDRSVSLPECRTLLGICQDETGSWVAMYVDATDVRSEAKGSGPPTWECACVLWRKLWASYGRDPPGVSGTVTFSWQQHRVCVSVPWSQAVGSLRHWPGAEPPRCRSRVCTQADATWTVQRAACSVQLAPAFLKLRVWGREGRDGHMPGVSQGRQRGSDRSWAWWRGPPHVSCCDSLCRSSVCSMVTTTL